MMTRSDEKLNVLTKRLKKLTVKRKYRYLIDYIFTHKTSFS